MRPNSVEEENKDNQPFCGTLLSSANMTESANAGYELFKVNCAQCHSKNMDIDMTGPALRNSFDMWNLDTISFRLYLNNSDDFKLKPRIRELRNKMKVIGRSHEHYLSLEETKCIVDYIQSRG